MNRSAFFRHLATAAVAWLCLWVGLGAAWAQESVGRVVMSIGNVTLERAGQERPAPRDTALQVGDTLKTASSSNAQIRFNDGAVVALRPGTDFKVNAFNYNGKADGSEQASLSLLKGGVRAVTGAIGRTNRDNLKVDAVVATIGIRGTGFNIVLCELQCRDRDPNAKNGLYAGVFEGRIAVSNASGTSVELGLNQFVYVAAADTPPVRLLAPPTLLKDTLDGQGQVQTRMLRANDVTEVAAEKVVEKAPVEIYSKGPEISASRVDRVQVAPPSSMVVVPSKFFDQNGLGDSQPLAVTLPTGTARSFQSAEFNPSGAQRRADNQLIEGVNSTTTLAFMQDDGGKLQAVVQNGTTAYAIQGVYTARQTEGGSDGGVISWGRWAGGSALIGNYGTVSYPDSQGFHWIAGARMNTLPADMVNSSYTFNLIGATRPTETVAGSANAWRVYGGNLTANFGTVNIGVNGQLNLYLISGGATGTYDMNFNGATTGGNVEFARVTSSVVRTQGTTSACASGCSGAGVVSFYGTKASHAGLTYEFNTGSSYVQGAAAFRR